MARPRKDAQQLTSPAVTPALTTWAEALGEALGRGVARGINAGISTAGLGGGGGGGSAMTAMAPARRRGRPPKAVSGGPVPPERRCKVDGCGREARSKGLCSAHYQAERRRQLAKQA